MMAAGPAEEQIDRERRHEGDDQANAQVSRGLRHGMAEKVSEPDPPPGPRQGAHGAVADKRDDAQPGSAREACRDCVHLRQKTAAQLKASGVSSKNTPGAMDQRSGAWRHQTEGLLHGRSAPAAE